MIRPCAVAALLAAACASPPEPGSGPADAGPQPPPPCGDRPCSAPNRCLERPGAPGVPACVPPGECEAVPAGRDPFGEALAGAALDRCDARFAADSLDFFPDNVKRDPWRLAHFDAVHDAPLTAPGWAETLVAELGDPADPLAASTALAVASERLDRPLDLVRGGYEPDAAAPLAVAMAELCKAHGQAASAADFAADAQEVPYELQAKVAPILHALSEAARERNAAFARVASLDQLWAAAPQFVLAARRPGGLNPASPTVRSLLLREIEWTRLYQGAYRLLAALEDAQLEAEAGATGFSFDRATPLGRVVIGDAQPQTYEETAVPVALLVDTGGDDVYRLSAGGTASARNPVSVLVDLDGDDTYGYAEAPTAGDEGRLPSDADGRFPGGDPAAGDNAVSASDRPRQGAGRLGIGVLFDLAGDDRYRSLRMSQGFGAMGVGVLWDRDGNDLWEAEAGAQGSALFGIGLLLDGAGDDERRLYTLGQGFGYTQGLGALVDGAGADVYFGNPGATDEGGDPLYWSPQLPGRGNSSFVQGAGFGRRDDTYGGYMSGGVGVLADLGTAGDRYTASVFGQGTGYWFGTGVLHDGGGDDAYEGKWYVQGSAAHFALCVFRDKGGSDTYNTGVVKPVATSMGQGHDFSVGWLWDESGDDVYRAPGLALGAGNANGWGFLVDGGGNDSYTVPADRCLGGFGEPGVGDAYRSQLRTLGIHVDVGGADTYVIGGRTADYSDKTVQAPAVGGVPLGMGVHVDAADGTLLVLP